MKKKLGLFLGCILFIILSVGSIPSGNKDNVEIKSDKKSENVENSENKTEEKKEYEISNVEVTSDGVATYVSGILQNNGGKKGYVQIMVPCYDKDGAKIGDALANVNNIAENGKWKFKAIFMGSEKPSKCNIEEMEVTGF